ncbi:TetR/AcrR family transcriptional regulator [Ottowia thiooxydans]|uniref:TetR/AcrR family transcriptional regulator n=1 Tax=Ottowia thiooxydans TaxID=219182 RepID=UPI00040B66C7|nr:TetR/AcrR family transcriptional regulator [Ottowia thiooxydans]
MGRPRTINREHLLDVAEALVAASGASSLSFGSVATAAGLSKASVQSAFGTREALVEAMLERWLQQEQKRFDAVAGATPSPSERIRAHVETTATETEAASSRIAAVLATLAGSDAQVSSAAQWYASRVGDFSAKTPEQKRLRIAFLAAEGAFFMRYLVGFPMSEKLWKEVFEDLKALGDGDESHTSGPKQAPKTGAKKSGS